MSVREREEEDERERDPKVIRQYTPTPLLLYVRQKGERSLSSSISLVQ